jgi:hypothetical protein
VTGNQIEIPAIQAPSLTEAEVQALFRLIIRRPAPRRNDDKLTTAEVVLITATNLLRGSYGFDLASTLAIVSRLWPWLEADDQQILMFNIVDRRYVGWTCREHSILIDAVTGDEVAPSQILSRVLESTAYNLYEMLDRQMALVRGARTSFWEGKDAPSQTPCGTAAADGDGLGEPQVVRDDPGAPVP